MKKVILIILCSIFVFTVVGCGNEKELEEENIKQEVTLKEDLDFEINSEITLFDLISENNKVKIASEDEKIDTSKLGQQELIIKYIVDNEEKEQSFKINIIDTEAPTIKYKSTLSTTKGTKIDLLKGVTASDNSKEKIEVKVEGEYSFNKTGTYKLKYVAIDKSNNKTEKEFTLKVNAKKTNNNSSTSGTTTNKNTNNNTSNNTTNNNTNNNNNASNNNNNNTITCDESGLAKENESYNNTVKTINASISEYEGLKKEAESMYKQYGGYIEKEEYLAEMAKNPTALEKAKLIARYEASTKYSQAVAEIAHWTLELENLKTEHAKRVKALGC